MTKGEELCADLRKMGWYTPNQAAAYIEQLEAQNYHMSNSMKMYPEDMERLTAAEARIEQLERALRWVDEWIGPAGEHVPPTIKSEIRAILDPNPNSRDIMNDPTYPEGVSQSDHIAHDIKSARFPQRSTVAEFLAEREAKAAKAEPVAYAYVNSDGECEEIGWGELPYDDPDWTRLYAAPPAVTEDAYDETGKSWRQRAEEAEAVLEIEYRLRIKAETDRLHRKE